MEKPFLVCHMFVSMDGKIDGAFMSDPNAVPARTEYGKLRNFYDCTTTIYGTTTMRAFADAAHVTECDYVGIESANKVPKKLEKAGLHVTKSPHVDAPFIDELPVALECELIKVNEDGSIIGKIVNVSVDEAVMNAEGKVDAAKLRAISYDPCSNTYVEMGKVVGKAFSDGGKLK